MSLKEEATEITNLWGFQNGLFSIIMYFFYISQLTLQTPRCDLQTPIHIQDFVNSKFVKMF